VTADAAEVIRLCTFMSEVVSGVRAERSCIIAYSFRPRIRAFGSDFGAAVAPAVVEDEAAVLTLQS
jgi:hypothetical protein